MFRLGGAILYEGAPVHVTDPRTMALHNWYRESEDWLRHILLDNMSQAYNILA